MHRVGAKYFHAISLHVVTHVNTRTKKPLGGAFMLLLTANEAPREAALIMTSRVA